jgi:RNA polymerase sigma-70 factor (ECF subfamily)
MIALAVPIADAPEPDPPSGGSEARRPLELDRATLVRCTSRDPMAFRAFVVRYERPVFALLSRLLGRRPELEDLAQETFLRAFRAFPTFEVDAGARPSTWLLTIATRLSLDFRKRRNRSEEPFAVAPEVPDETTPETERARRALGRAIEGAAARLSDDQRAAFVLAEYHGLSMLEIARALDVPEATAKTRLFRARDAMRAALKGEREELRDG